MTSYIYFGCPLVKCSECYQGDLSLYDKMGWRLTKVRNCVTMTMEIENQAIMADVDMNRRYSAINYSGTEL